MSRKVTTWSPFLCNQNRFIRRFTERLTLSSGPRCQTKCLGRVLYRMSLQAFLPWRET